jgi:hypothetical protein
MLLFTLSELTDPSLFCDLFKAYPDFPIIDPVIVFVDGFFNTFLLAYATNDALFY